MTYYLCAMLQISTNEILKKNWKVDILGVDIVGVDIVEVDILGS